MTPTQGTGPTCSTSRAGPTTATPKLAPNSPTGGPAGSRITAGHSRPPDNGYRLYLGDEAQIMPPAEAEIEAAVGALGPLREVPLGSRDGPRVTRHGDAMVSEYLRAVGALSADGA